MLCCNMITKSLRCVSLEVRSFPYYDGLTVVDKFLDAFEREVPEKHHFQELDLVLCTTPARWWGMHKESFDGWREYRKMMRLWFGRPKFQLTEKYDGRNDLLHHLAKWADVSGTELQPEWVQLFCHNLDVIPLNWYLETELCHDIEVWDILRQGFLMTFNFEDGFKCIDKELQEVKLEIFRIPQDPLDLIQPDWST